MPDEKRQIDPKPLSPEYHKAHKQLMLWAAILFIWELVGIDLGKAKETGGNAGAIISAIKSPQAVPWVLLILVAYFLFKTTIEWYQCTPARRTLRVARTDFVAAWVVSLTAYALYAYQAIRRVQVADAVQTDTSRQISAVAGFVIGQILATWTWDYLAKKYDMIRESRSFSWTSQDTSYWLKWLIFFVLCAIGLWLQGFVTGYPTRWRLLLSVLLFSLVFTAVGTIIFRRGLRLIRKFATKTGDTASTD